MKLTLSTWCEVEAYLADRQDIIIPIGSTEQHGPTGLIGTDIICAEAIAARLAERTGALVAPGIPIGMAHYHLAFPGTLSLRASTLIRVVVDIISSLARHGFNRLYFVNGHGGNIAPVTAAFAEYWTARSERRVAGPELRCRLANWWEMPSVAMLVDGLYGSSEGLHAQPSEVAVTQYLHPDRVRHRPLQPAVAPSGDFTDAEDYRRRFPDGRLGADPSLATSEAGRRIIDTAVTDMLEDYEKWRDAA